MGYKMANFNKKKTNMNADILEGQWKEIKGEVKQKWGKLTDDDLAQVEGKEEQLLGLLQKMFCRRGMDTPRKKPTRNLRSSSSAMGSPLNVSTCNCYLLDR